VLKLLIVGLHNKTKSNGGAFKLGHVSSGEEGKKCSCLKLFSNFNGGIVVSFTS
jgi:hypothetical protein